MCRTLFWLMIGLFSAPLVQAMDAFEYQIYNAEINKEGEFTLETHLNFGESRLAPPSTTQLPSNHLTHLTFEFARGITPYWEVGMYLQSARTADGTFRYAGTKLRSKLVVPGDESGVQLGVNFEISNVPLEFETERWGSEIRPILGYAYGPFMLTFNPILDIRLSAHSDATPDFSPATKLVLDTQNRFGIGLEYYAELGALNALKPLSEADQYLLAAYDRLQDTIEMNIAAGPGMNSNSNRWLAKAIFGFTF